MNRLIHEDAPYLLQHAHNSVDWYPWGEEAFAKARAENKPVFLSIGYATCHWCHVMEHESFEDLGLAERLNQDFVAIKVDREMRPDVDETYMRAVLLINSLSDGCPSGSPQSAVDASREPPAASKSAPAPRWTPVRTPAHWILATNSCAARA
ncbi:hypothetical protein CCR91_15605 [Thiorhodovibrio winogradskyi]|nr:hypothetical protein [Thiorhodovibrio winogradskyi]